MNCDFVARGLTTEDVRRAAAAHALNAHGLKDTPDLEGAIESLIHDEDSEAHSRSTGRPNAHVSTP